MTSKTVGYKLAYDESDFARFKEECESFKVGDLVAEESNKYYTNNNVHLVLEFNIDKMNAMIKVFDLVTKKTKFVTTFGSDIGFIKLYNHPHFIDSWRYVDQTRAR